MCLLFLSFLQQLITSFAFKKRGARPLPRWVVPIRGGNTGDVNQHLRLAQLAPFPQQPRKAVQHVARTLCAGRPPRVTCRAFSGSRPPHAIGLQRRASDGASHLWCWHCHWHYWQNVSLPHFLKRWLVRARLSRHTSAGFHGGH